MRVKIFISVSQTPEEGFLFFHYDVTIDVQRFGDEMVADRFVAGPV